jgi:hypothetical protein
MLLRHLHRFHWGFVWGQSALWRVKTVIVVVEGFGSWAMGGVYTFQQFFSKITFHAKR